MSRLFLVGMSGSDSLVNLKELIDPIKNAFDGVVWVLHDSFLSPEATYLESVKGEGSIIHSTWSRRHDFARNHYLYCGSLQEGDWCCQIDDKERLNPVFSLALPGLIADMEKATVNMVMYFGKPFLFQYHESLQYSGSPHEGLRRLDGKARAIELNELWPNEKDVRYSVRDEQREEYQWVDHYANYLLYPWGSNHALLGLNHWKGDQGQNFQKREVRRLAFREEMKKRGFSRTLEGLKTMLSQPLDDWLKGELNAEKTWSDYYHFHILGNKAVKHSHKPEDAIAVD